MEMVITYEGTVQEFVWRNEEKHEKTDDIKTEIGAGNCSKQVR
jgi:hypothetical protein